ncbi:mutanase [Colletotrichum plurivorum]|uniref:Mutanase n=1 Tax=Colletotrichum plurivorum TaxID=2175906 RepID=A0A8H6J2J6_9PEZI|nr:mutanase [Colletotrichum plurivorum]
MTATPRRLVICVDGTWLHPDGGPMSSGTPGNIMNVYRLFASIYEGEVTDETGKRFLQQRLYVPGIGSDDDLRPTKRLLSGLTSKASRPLKTPSLEDEVCIRGIGANDFDEICRKTCSLGYCPQTACVCRATGALGKLPTEVPGEVFPAEGLNSNYIGLCNVACLYGSCFPKYCGETQYPLIEPTVSPFNPPSCTSGSGDGDWALLCNFACRHGFCSIGRCKCTSQGSLSLLNPTRQVKVTSRIGEDHGLCAFACSRGLCPKQACDSGQQEQTDPLPPQVEMPHLDKDCYIFPECVDLDNPQASSCRDGYSRVFFDRSAGDGKFDTKKTFPVAGRSQDVSTPADYFWDQFGSLGNRAPLLLCEKLLNQMKGHILGWDDPASRTDMKNWREAALKGDVTSQSEYFQHISRSIAVFVYLNHPDALPTVQNNRESLFVAARFLSTLIVEFATLEALIRLFDEAWYEQAATLTREWAEDMLNEIQDALAPLVLSGRAPPNMASINIMIANLKARLGDIKPPPRK